MKILVVNAGSSSLKYQLFDMDTETVIVKGGAERIGIPGSVLKHKTKDGEKLIEQDMPNHKVAMQLVLKALVDPEYGVIRSMSEIDAVGHRVLHSGGRLRPLRPARRRSAADLQEERRARASAYARQHPRHGGLPRSHAGHADGARL